MPILAPSGVSHGHKYPHWDVCNLLGKGNFISELTECNNLRTCDM